MTHVESECQRLFRSAVRLRDRYCQFCGRPGTECNHIVLVSQGNWEVQYDLDYGVALCAEHHRGCAQAPHVSPKQFKSDMLPIILQRMAPARAAKVQAYMDHPGVATDRADFRAIKKRLKADVERLDRDSYMDTDCEVAGVQTNAY